jgi:hypothetical protein
MCWSIPIRHVDTVLWRWIGGLVALSPTSRSIQWRCGWGHGALEFTTFPLIGRKCAPYSPPWSAPASSNGRTFGGGHFFYCTDSIVTYFAVSSGSLTSPGLHDMVQRIKELEIYLQVKLEVIHVPGTSTINTQSTDGLSRGIWASALHQHPDQQAIIAEIFTPVPLSPDVGTWALNKAGYSQAQCYVHMSWDRPIVPDSLSGCLSVWA